MSPAFGYLCRFLLPSSLVCRRCAAGGLRGWTAVGGSRGRAPVLLRFLGVFALPRFPPGGAAPLARSVRFLSRLLRFAPAPGSSAAVPTSLPPAPPALRGGCAATPRPIV